MSSLIIESSTVANLLVASSEGQNRETFCETSIILHRFLLTKRDYHPRQIQP